MFRMLLLFVFKNAPTIYRQLS